MGHDERVLFLQRGVEPSDLDQVIGIVDSADLAAKLVEAWNEYWPEPPLPWDREPSTVERVQAEAENRAREEQADLEG